MLDYVKSDSNSRSPPAILNRLDHYGLKVEWHPEPGEEKRTLLTKLIEPLVQKGPVVRCLQIGSFSGYTTLLLSSLLPTDCQLIVYEEDDDCRQVSTELVSNLANNKRVTFINHIDTTGTTPFNIVFFTSDSDDKCFETLRLLEQNGLTNSGTVLITDRILTRPSPQMMIYVRTGTKTFTSKMYPCRESFSQVQDAIELTIYN